MQNSGVFRLPHRPMQPHILLLNGPAGVGKSTVAACLKELLPGAVCIHGDILRDFAPSDARKQLGPGATYRAGAALASAYLGMGAPRIIFEYVFENPAQVERFVTLAPGGVPLHLMTLWASLETVSAREGARAGRERLGERVTTCYRAMETNLERLGMVVQTNGRSPAEIATEIHGVLLGGVGGSLWCGQSFELPSKGKRFLRI